MVYVKITFSTNLSDISEINEKIENFLKEMQKNGFKIESKFITHKKEA